MKRKPNRRRTDLYIDMDDAMWQELVREAELRNVSIQQHVYDLLRARWLARQGETRLAAMFWLPGDAPGSPPAAPPPVAPPPPPVSSDDDAATAMKATWLGMLGEDEPEQ